MNIFKTDNSIRKTGIIGPKCREIFMPILEGGPLSKLGVGAAGVSDLHGEYYMHRPRSSISVLVGTLAGKGLLHTEEGSQILKPGDLLVAPKGVSHRYETIRGRPWKVVWFNLGREIPFNRVRVLKADYLPSMAKDFLDVKAEASAGLSLSAEARMAKEHYLAVLLQRIIHYEKRGQQVLHEARLQVLWSSVTNDIARKWRLLDLARIAGYSPKHLNRICNRQYGVSAMNYLTRLRMQQATHLLGQETHKILSIADQCGYTNPFAFSVAFKRCFGVSPRQFLSHQAERETTKNPRRKKV
jgi:AraC-like DNA-binding protein